MTFLDMLLSFLIGLAANGVTTMALEKEEKKLQEALDNEETIRKALASFHSLRDEVRRACTGLARNRDKVGVGPQERPLWRLLSNEGFQTDLVEWLMAGGIEEGNAVKDRLVRSMETALEGTGVSAKQIEFLKTEYFNAVEKTIYSNSILAHWRHQLSLDYVHEQVAYLRRRAEEAAGIYSPEKKRDALDRYCEKALSAWDIIDLSNLPEGDIHMATQKLLLRQLYMPLRLTVEISRDRGGDTSAFTEIEAQRETKRLWEAGRRQTAEFDLPKQKERFAVGERLKVARRMVVLGDPGAGKTTMLRWIATAYLLRCREDPAYSQFPDAQTLPGRRWIPLLIRCRDLGEVDLCRSFTDFLAQHLRKTELLPEDAEIMKAVVLDRIAKGEVLLLVDGLDEITNALVRVTFCKELECTAARYPEASVIITSRIVGYRDMPYRMGVGFEHGVIAELVRDDKDLFARRWVEVTEQHKSTEEKEKLAQEMLDALHSNNRIEKLTGNPMLLTTLALIKRKVGKLPSRRNKLYSEAVSVLLNWNPLHETIEEEEAVPQLEYLAYEMCYRGVQRLTEDEVLQLLEKVREEYLNVRAIRRRSPEEFLRLLEARSSILIKSGSLWLSNQVRETPVWEFRHLTLQEYLAARALIDGRYPGRDRTKRLAEQVAPLAGSVRELKLWPHIYTELEVVESWQETLRLLAADCKDDDVDDVLLAILAPMDSEEMVKTARPRAVLAARCLADEPNVSDEVAEEVLKSFARIIEAGDGLGGPDITSVDVAAMEISASIWNHKLQGFLVDEFFRRDPKQRAYPGRILGRVQVKAAKKDPSAFSEWFKSLSESLQSENHMKAVTAALAVMGAGIEEPSTVPEIVPSLLGLLTQEMPVAHAAALALESLSGGNLPERFYMPRRIRYFARTSAFWRPKESELSIIADLLNQARKDEPSFKVNLIGILESSSRGNGNAAIRERLEDPDEGVRAAAASALGRLGDKLAVDPLIRKLEDPDEGVRATAASALGRLGDKLAVDPLIRKLEDPDEGVRDGAIFALGQLGDKLAVDPLIRKLEDLDEDVRAAAAGALGALGDTRGSVALSQFLGSPDPDLRRAVVKQLATKCDQAEQRLLSDDLDGTNPWIDPQEIITEDRVAEAAQALGTSPEETRSRYESLSSAFCLKLSWAN